MATINEISTVAGKQLARFMNKGILPAGSVEHRKIIDLIVLIEQQAQSAVSCSVCSTPSFPNKGRDV